MSLFKRKNKQKENEILFENLTTSQIDFERPNIDTINRIINKCKDKFNTLKQIDLSELSYCFKDNSLETILKVLINVENDYNDGLIKDMSYKVFYPYIMKENNKGKYNELNEYDKKVIAYHEIGHFISDYVLNKNYGIISLGGYGEDLGHYKSVNNDENHISNLNRVKNDIIVCLSGKACTEKILNDTFSGSGDDVEKARYLYKLLTKSAMLGFDKLPPLSQNDDAPIGDKYYQDEQLFLNDCLTKAEDIISNNKEKIEEIYSKLIETNLLFKNDLIEIMQR